MANIKKPDSNKLTETIRVLVSPDDLRLITERRGHEPASSYGRRLMTTGIDPERAQFRNLPISPDHHNL